MRKLLLILIIFTASQVSAAEFSLSPEDSIQNTINSAANGDVINLDAGVYTESFNLNGKAITIRGSGKDTILKALKSKTSITFNKNESKDSVIENISFHKDLQTKSIEINRAAPTIRQCWFYKNNATDLSNNIFVVGTNSHNQSATITDNVFYKNGIKSFQPGDITSSIRVYDSSPTINNNTFISNDRLDVQISELSKPLMNNNFFSYINTVATKKESNANGMPLALYGSTDRQEN